jgi:thioredoxin-like negative regulator of GroEL
VIEILLQAERAMSFGMLDQAERLYRHAAETDPLNSIAVVGLARVAIERGDDNTAYGLGMAALEIDPENDAARRLVDRLTEVIEARGDTVPETEAQPERQPAPAPVAVPGAYLPPAEGRPAPPPKPKAKPQPGLGTSITRRRLKRSGIIGRLLGGGGDTRPR